MKSRKLYIFDLDGTLIDDMDFYRKIYTENLEKLVIEKRGKEGLEIINMIRKANRGKGELALLALGISYDEWFSGVSDKDIKLLLPKPDVAKIIKKLKGIKVVFTGASLNLAKKILIQAGFDIKDFDEIVAFEKPSVVPVKLTASDLVFRYLLNKYKVAPHDVYVFGDEYEFDLLPAKTIGLNTIEVRHKSGLASHFIKSLLELPKYLGKIKNDEK